MTCGHGGLKKRIGRVMKGTSICNPLGVSCRALTLSGVLAALETRFFCVHFGSGMPRYYSSIIQFERAGK